MKINDLKKLLKIIEVDRKMILFLVLLLIINSFLEVFGIGLIGNYLSLMITNESIFKNFDFINLGFFGKSNSNSLKNLTIILIIVFLFKTLFQFWINSYLLKFIGKIQFKIRNKLINIFQKKNFLDFIQYKKSDITETVFNLAGVIGHTAMNALLNLVSSIFLTFSIVILLIFTNYKILFLSLLSFFLIFIIFQKIFKNRINKFGRYSSEASTNIFDSINYFYDSFSEIKILNKKNYFKNLIKISGFKYYKFQYLYSLISLIPKYLVEILFIVIALIFLLYLNLNNISLISVVPIATIFIFSFLKLMPAFVLIIRNISDLNFSRYAINKIYNLYILYKTKNKSSKIKGKKFGKFKNFKIKIKSFKYPKQNKNILNNINLSISKNQCVGIIGSSGSGKSTLLNFITGLVFTQNSKIFVNNILINKKNKSLWQNKIAYIKQNPFFFNDTIKENITLERFNKKFNRSSYQYSISKSYLKDLVKNNNSNLKNKLGEGGQFVSGGQRQRMAIARSIYHDKEVLIFDEPTSALDDVAKERILSQLQKLKRIKTIIIVSHDIKVKKICDKIYEIKNFNIKKVK